MIFIFLLLIIVTTISGKKAVSKEPDIDGMFSKTSDDIIHDLLGDSTDLRRSLYSHLTLYSNKTQTAQLLSKQFNPHDNAEDNNTDTETTTERIKRFTEKPLNSSAAKFNEKEMMKFLKLRMLKREIKMIIKEKNTFIPSFQDDDDDAVKPTRRFQLEDLDTGMRNDTRRVFYFQKEDKYRNPYAEKYRVAELMRQFIYMTRYKMSIMTELRKKYLPTIKYKIGYLFGLYRMVQMQQRSLYSTLSLYRRNFHNPSIGHHLLYKIVQLDVDMDDLVRYIRRLDANQKMRYWPGYFDDTSDEINYGNATGLTPPTPPPPQPGR